MRRNLIAGLLAGLALTLSAPTALAGGEVLTGGAIPRVAPFTARVVSCGETNCLDIAWKVRGQIGPSLTWTLVVARPDGTVVYRGSGRSRTGKRVSGLLEPSTAPQCGRYTLSLRVEDPTAANVEAHTSAVRRHRCRSARMS